MKTYNKFYIAERYDNGFDGWYTNDELDKQKRSDYYYEYDSGNFTFYNANYHNISIVGTDEWLMNADEQYAFDGDDKQIEIYKDALRFDRASGNYYYDSDKIIKNYANNSWNEYANGVYQTAIDYQLYNGEWCFECNSEVIQIEGGYICECETELTYQEQYEAQLMQLWTDYYAQIDKFNKNQIIAIINASFNELSKHVDIPSHKLMQLYYEVTGRQSKLNILK